VTKLTETSVTVVTQTLRLNCPPGCRQCPLVCKSQDDGGDDDGGGGDIDESDDNNDDDDDDNNFDFDDKDNETQQNRKKIKLFSFSRFMFYDSAINYFTTSMRFNCIFKYNFF
jgi:hypothetical protein